MTRRLVAAAIVLAAARVPVSAQSPSPSASAAPRVYTEEDLKKTRGNVQGGVIAGLPSPSPKASAAPADAPQSEPRWRARGQQRRQAIASAETKLKEAEAALTSLGVVPGPGLVPTGQDPLAEHQARVAAARKAIDAAREELAAARRAMEALEDEARQKQVPPGWLRER